MLNRSGIICAGNWIVDLVHDVDRWPNESELVRIGAQTRGVGGGAANVITALAKLETGLPLYPMGAIGEDEYGAFIINECSSLGVPTSGLISKTNFATAHTHVMSVGGQSRTFFYQGGANDTLTINDFPEGTFKSTSARIFYLGYLTLLRDLDQLIEDNLTNAAKVLKRAQNAGLVTCVDLVSIHHPEFSRIVGRAAPFVDFLISNEIEAAQATDTKVGPESLTSVKTLVQMAHKILDLGVRNAVIIHCVERVVWVGSDRNVFTIEIEALRADEIASNLGAGDAFCAGLLYGIHESRGPERAVQLGNAVAQASLKGLTATSAISAAAIKSLR
tara:strand:- start:2910 stop:3905 length:996 start_codon:yes stop_codon:yes gene_type:complete